MRKRVKVSLLLPHSCTQLCSVHTHTQDYSLIFQMDILKRKHLSRVKHRSPLKSEMVTHLDNSNSRSGDNGN